MCVWLHWICVCVYILVFAMWVCPIVLPHECVCASVLNVIMTYWSEDEIICHHGSLPDVFFFSSLFTLFNSNLLLVLQAPVSLFIPRTAFLFFCNSPSLSLRHNDRPCLDVVVLRYPRESNLSCVILWSEVKVSCSVSHCRSPHILRLSHFSTLYHVTAVEGHHILQLSSMVTTAVSKWFLVRVK